MEKIKTPIPDLFILKPQVYFDKRGYFFESYNKKVFRDLGLNYEFVQDNQSMSSYGVIRGLHYQLEPYAQAKLVRVVLGKILDVAVDLRKNSPTFGQVYAVELSDENKLQFLIPRGFAHGFAVLSEKAIVFYKTDGFYNKEHERGIRFNDPQLNIDWKIPEDKRIVSDKDLNNPLFKDAETNFFYNG